MYLCPGLGIEYAEISEVRCQAGLQNPFGKTLPISYIGISPFIKRNPFGGSEPLVIEILAQKFGFYPKFVPERAWDVTRKNGTTYGMVHRVRLQSINEQLKIKLNVCHIGIHKTNRNWNWANSFHKLQI